MQIQLAESDNLDVPTTSNSTSKVWNVNQAQNNPFLPRMFFPNSSVMINYNFSGPINPGHL